MEAIFYNEKKVFLNIFSDMKMKNIEKGFDAWNIHFKLLEENNQFKETEKEDNRVFVIDEAQNISKNNLLFISKIIDSASPLILIGDLKQSSNNENNFFKNIIKSQYSNIKYIKKTINLVREQVKSKISFKLFS